MKIRGHLGGQACKVAIYCLGTLGDLSRRTGRDVTTLSSAAKRLQIRSKTDSDLVERVKKLLDSFS